MTDLRALVADAKPAIYWSDRAFAPEVGESLKGAEHGDLVIIGGGFTGLWAALQAAQAEPGRSIHVIEAEAVGHGASSRNGGFCEASLTHGLLNGISHWPDDIAAIEQMGSENLAGLLSDIQRHGIDAALEETGVMLVATADWQVDDLHDYAGIVSEHGGDIEILDAVQTRSELDSPSYLGGVVEREGTAIIDPAKLVWGLKSVVESLGVTVYEHSRVTSIEDTAASLTVRTDQGVIHARRVLVATNAWAEPERQIRNYVVPIYDHVLMTEPLSNEQMASIGWSERRGVSDSANQFHYYRLTEDNRILWGGYDANYYKGNGMGPEYEQRVESHVKIAGHFFETFPQLEGLGFSNRWAGPIGTTSKFSAAFGRKYDNRLAWVAGYTGLGVGASRWGARVGLDLVDGHETERVELAMVRRKPMPFPPEPLRNAVIQFTRKQIANADLQEGESGLWLRSLDRFGIGFDS